MTVDIEAWVKSRVEEAGRHGLQESRKACKVRLISERPEEQQKIRETINKMSPWPWPLTPTPQSTLAQEKLPNSHCEDSVNILHSSNQQVAAPVRESSRCKDMESSRVRSVDPGQSRASDGNKRKLNPKIEEFYSSIRDQRCGSSAHAEPGAERVKYEVPSRDEQDALLGQRTKRSNSGSREFMPDSLENAVLCSAGALQNSTGAMPQYALLGYRIPEQHGHSTMDNDSRIFLNTNAPFSAFICGLQGSGKSHTASCIVENCLIQSRTLGLLQCPLSALVFHYGEHTFTSFRPSELAFLSNLYSEFSRGANRPAVTILVSPSSYPSLRSQYAGIPGAKVRPFLIDPGNLTISTMLALMAVERDQTPPLYISQVSNILRQMASEGSGEFVYEQFRQRLRAVRFDARQTEYLNQRLDLLESFLDLNGKSTAPGFSAGEVTIIDLSCPFMDEHTACILFKIGMSMFLESQNCRGKLIVVDEAHKFIRDSPAAKDLTEALLSVIRQQRHYGSRVIISTQEPTISPRLIDLCSLTIIHRFSSPHWFQILKKHICIESNESPNSDSSHLFKEISALRTGEAVIFAPSAVLEHNAGVRMNMGARAFEMMIRRRITWDSGKSLVSV